MRKICDTESLWLVTLDRDDAELVLDYYNRNKEFLQEWEPVKGSDFYTLEYHKRQLERDMQAIENGTLLRLWILKKENERKVIGTVAFNNIIRGAFQSCHLGYKLDKEEINKGFMAEAIRKGINIAFGQLKLHRIEANIMPKNKASIRVVEKLGFYNEGLALKYLKINGNWEDHIHMVLLDDRYDLAHD